MKTSNNDWSINPFAKKYKRQLWKKNQKNLLDLSEISGSTNKTDWMAIASYIVCGFAVLYFGIHILVYLMGAYN